MKYLIKNRMDNPSLLEKAMALYEQEQQQSTPDCLHDFDYDSSYGQKSML